MRATSGTHILFDFFGTLVEYSPSRTEQGYHGSHRLLRELGATGAYAEYPAFLAAWARTFAEFDRRSAADDREFSMTEVVTEFLAPVLRRPPEPDEVDAFATRYLAEWNTTVRYPPGIADLIRGLAGSHRLAVVTNTHHAPLVPDHLAAMGLAGEFAAVVTSVDVGWCKPHPRIYAAALETLGVAASEAVFVGDSFEPDFAGPRRAGIEAFLIDPERRAPVPEARRLDTVFDLPERLAAGEPGGAPAPRRRRSSS